MPVPRQSFTHCRTLGHSWDKANPTRSPRNNHEVVMAVVCVNCGTVRNDRLDVISERGVWTHAELVGRAYDYQPGYSDTRRTKGEWRVEFLTLNAPATRRNAPRNVVAERRAAALPTPIPIETKRRANR